MKMQRKHVKQEQYTFSPKIDKRSELIVQNKVRRTSSNRKETSINKYNELYEDHRHREAKKQGKTEEHYKAYTFTPQINIYNFNMKFDQRQEVYRQKQEEKQKTLKYQERNPVDSISGQRLFSPQISSKPAQARSMKNLNEYMHSYYDFFSQRKNVQNLTKMEEFKQKSNTKHIGEASEQLYNERKLHAFRSIFKTLDVDQDKIISHQSIDTKSLSLDVRKIVNPILSKIREEKCPISETEFLEYCDLIYETSTFDKKQILLNCAKNYRTTRPRSGSKERLNFDGIVNYRERKKSYNF